MLIVAFFCCINQRLLGCYFGFLNYLIIDLYVDIMYCELKD